MSIALSREGPTFLVSFFYDPEVVAGIKGIPGRRWDKQRKRWEVPANVDTYDALVRIAKLNDTTISVHPGVVAEIANEREAQQAAMAIASHDDGEAAYGHDYVTEPYAHQRAGLAFLQRLGSAGLFWEMGLGKTKTALDYCEWLATRPAFDTKVMRVLVITPNSVVDNWGREVETHTGRKDYVLLRAPMTLLNRSRKLATKRYSITNTEAMQGGPLAKAIMAMRWDVLIVDESQRFKNPKAMRTKHLLKIQADHRLILTGTPLTNAPQDLWSQLSFVRPGILGTWWHFRQEYLLLDHFGNTIGVRKAKEPDLAKRIASVGYRRLKSEVLDLPEKVYEDRLVDLSPVQKQAYRTMQEELRMELESGDQVVAHSILTQLLRLAQVTAGLIGHGDTYEWDETNPKLLELDSLLDDLKPKPVVIFGVYRRELEALAARYAPPSVGLDKWDLPPIIYGGVLPERRQQLIDQFQSGQRRLLFVQAHSGGIGINLTAAQYAVYYTRGWSLEDYLQSQDRLHRIGQQGTVTILHMVARGTIDEDIAKALAAKEDLSRRLTGDQARALATEALRKWKVT